MAQEYKPAGLNGKFIIGMPGQGRPPGAGSKPGLGGQRAHLRNFAAKLAVQAGLVVNDPIEMLLFVALTGRDPSDFAIDVGKKRGGPRRIEDLDFKTDPAYPPRLVDINVRLECAKAAAPYLHPKLSAIAVQTNDETRRLDDDTARSLMADPETRDMLERMQAKAAVIFREQQTLMNDTEEIT